MRPGVVRAFSRAGVVVLVAMGLSLIVATQASAQTGASGSRGLSEEPIGGAGDGGLPSTSIAPAGPPQATPTPKPRRPAERAVHRHRATKPTKPVKAAKAAVPMKFEVEPAKAVLRLNQNTPIYTQPSIKSVPIKQAQSGRRITVTGSTHYFLQVKLRDGQTGYVLLKAADLVKPTDKIFVLTHDASVLNQPNRWSKKLADVHRGHAVHIVGIALNYAKIRMRSGLEGYIPMVALE